MTDLTQETLSRALAEMELRLVREIHSVKDSIPSEPRIRELARLEMGLVHTTVWTARNALMAVGMFTIAISTFVMTALHGNG